MIRRLALLVVLAGSVSSCDFFTDPPVPCKNLNVRIITTAGATPDISWDPACGIGRLRISEDRIDGATLWSIGSNEGKLYPTVRYGEVPAGIVEVIPAAPLPTGTPMISIYDMEKKLIAQSKLSVP